MRRENLTLLKPAIQSRQRQNKEKKRGESARPFTRTPPLNENISNTSNPFLGRKADTHPKTGDQYRERRNLLSSKLFQREIRENMIYYELKSGLLTYEGEKDRRTTNREGKQR